MQEGPVCLSVVASGCRADVGVRAGWGDGPGALARGHGSLDESLRGRLLPDCLRSQPASRCTMGQETAQPIAFNPPKFKEGMIYRGVGKMIGAF